MLDLYINIRKKRRELGMSQDELARKVGYTSRSTVARVENGEIDLPRSKIFAFAEALKTTPGELMGLDGIEENGTSDGGNDEIRHLFVKVSKDSDLMLILERAYKDSNFRDRLIAISRLLESDK